MATLVNPGAIPAVAITIKQIGAAAKQSGLVFGGLRCTGVRNVVTMFPLVPSMLIMSREERRAYRAQLAPYLCASLVFFLVGAGAGLVIVNEMPDLANRFVENLAGFVKGFAGMAPWQLAIAIFLNNSIKTLIAILLGTLFGIVPCIFLLANGAALGLALSLSIQSRGLWISLVSIVPHGVIELPAVFLGTSVGLLLGMRTLRRLGARPETPIGAEIGLGIRYFCAVIAPLLLLAALVEAFVTASLVGPR